MRKIFVVAAAVVAATFGAVSAQAANDVKAGGWTPKEILFGKQYNGNVSAVRVDRGSWERHSYPMQAIYPTGNSLALAQTAVAEDPSLSAALKVRGIAPHNVLWVQTAFNGGKIVYYR